MGDALALSDYSGLATAGCCDTIWLPHIELLNIVTYDDVSYDVGVRG